MRSSDKMGYLLDKRTSKVAIAPVVQGGLLADPTSAATITINARDLRSMLRSMSGSSGEIPPACTDINFVKSRSDRFGIPSFRRKRWDEIGPTLQTQPHSKSKRARSKRPLSESSVQESSQNFREENGGDKPAAMSSIFFQKGQQQAKVHPVVITKDSPELQLSSTDIMDICDAPVDYCSTFISTKAREMSRKKKLGMIQLDKERLVQAYRNPSAFEAKRRMSARSKTIKMSAYLPGNTGHNPDKPGQAKVKKRLYEHVMSHRDEITEADYLDDVKMALS